MNKRQTIIRFLLMFLLFTGTFSVANASTGYTKTIQQEGSNPVQYTYEQESLEKENKKLEEENEKLKEKLEKEKAKNRYNYYPPYYGFGYRHSGSYIYIGYPRTYIFGGHRPHYMHPRPHRPPLHRPPHHGRPHR